MMMITPAILLSRAKLAMSSCPTTVAVAPSATNTVVKPSTKAIEDITTVA